MLKFREVTIKEFNKGLNKEVERKELVSERYGFKRPYFVPEETWVSFRNEVFAFSDYVQLRKLSEKEDLESGDIEKMEVLKKTAKKDVSDLAKLVTDGLKWYSGKHGITEEFNRLYLASVSYQKKYIGEPDWDETRIERFTAIKNMMISVFNSYLNNADLPEFQLKLSSKYVEMFLNPLFGLDAKSSGDKKSGHVTGICEKSLAPAKAFRIFAMVILMNSGVTPKQKVVTVDDIF